MLTEKLIEHLHGPHVAFITTRDTQLRPRTDLSVGVRAHPDRAHLTVLLPEAASANALGNLRANGRVALTALSPLTLEAYQFKGAFASAAAATPDEEAVVELFLAKIAPVYQTYGVPNYWLGVATRPAVAMVFRVEAVFDQAPRPGAGAALPAAS